MPGLTPLGVFHTAFALVALVCGFLALIRYKEISPQNRIGQAYVLMTAVTAATSLGIYQHGGFGPQHILAILTLAALGGGTLGALTTWFGRASREIQAISYSSTILLHLIPGVTEALTRLPPDKPWVASPTEPVMGIVFVLLFVAFIAGVWLQIRWLRASS